MSGLNFEDRSYSSRRVLRNMEESITTRAHRRRFRMLLILAVMAASTSTRKRKSATKLRRQSYASIASGYTDAHFKGMFGVAIDEFEAIHSALLLPNPVRTYDNDVIESKTALLMLLAWLRNYRLRELEEHFGWSRSRCSRIVHEVSQTIYAMWGSNLDATSREHNLLRPERLDTYADAI